MVIEKKMPELESKSKAHNTGMEVLDNFSKLMERCRPVTYSVEDSDSLDKGSPVDDDLLDESKIYVDEVLLKRGKHRKSLVECLAQILND